MASSVFAWDCEGGLYKSNTILRPPRLFSVLGRISFCNLWEDRRKDGRRSYLHKLLVGLVASVGLPCGSNKILVSSHKHCVDHSNLVAAALARILPDDALLISLPFRPRLIIWNRRFDLLFHVGGRVSFAFPTYRA